MNERLAVAAGGRTSLRLVAWFSVAALLAMAVLLPTARPALGGHGVTVVALPNETITDNNPTCAQAAAAYGGGQTWIQLKIEGTPTNGDYTLDDNGTPGDTSDDLVVTISGYEAEGDESFDWSSNFGVDAVIVKAGSDKHNLYVYAPDANHAEATSGTDLGPQSGQGNGISHVSFCYDESNPAPSSAPPSGDLGGETDSPPPSSAPPSSDIGGETDAPEVTLPPTSMSGDGAVERSDSWRVLLLGLAVLVAGLLVLTPVPARRRR